MGERAEDNIQNVRVLSATGEYGKAFDIFIKTFEKYPRLKPMYEPEFRTLLLKLNDVLDADMEVIFFNFGRALKVFPNSIYLLNDIGKYLYKCGYYTEAWGHFQKALKLDSGFVSAEKNLNSLKNLLVDRWHFRMLNDKIRNEAYLSAISETLMPFYEKVLDIGTGTGLLAMYANVCIPSNVLAVDSSQIMTQLAIEVTIENRQSNISIVNAMSTDMNELSICGRRSLLITELFDAGLFGEHVLRTLSHAWEHLITEEARVIPIKAEFFVIGAESDHLNRKYQLCTSAKTLLNIPTLNVHIINYEESYDCEDVHLYKDIRYLTEPHSLLKVEFNNSVDIKDKLNRLEPYDVDFKVTDNGQINTVIGWFKLFLHRDDITVTTDPRSKKRANAWQQAVFFDAVPKTVEANDIVNAKFLLNGGKLTRMPEDNISITRISADNLKFLNDTEYIKKINACIGMVCVYLGQTIEISETNIIDLCPFPIFGLQMLKRGAESLICSAKTDDDKAFLETVFNANNIPLSRVIILEGEDWNQNAFGIEKYHAIFVHIFDMCGDIDLRLKNIAQHLKDKHLQQGGLFMPANVTLFGQIISSHWLDINNRVYDKNTVLYKMAIHVNKYQVSQNFCLDFSLLEYTAISDPVDLGTCSGVMRSEVVNVPIINDGSASAILVWYGIELMEDTDEISTNRSMSFMDGTAFLADPSVPLVCGGVANILRCVDPDGAFKLMIDDETA